MIRIDCLSIFYFIFYVNSQLPTVNCQLSTVNCQLSIVPRQLSKRVRETHTDKFLKLQFRFPIFW